MENGQFIDKVVADPDNDITKEIVAVSNFDAENVCEDGGMPDSVAAGPHLSRDCLDERDNGKEDGTPETPQKSKSKKKKVRKKSKKSKSNKNPVENDGTVLAITVDEAEQNKGEVTILVAEEEEQPQQAILLVTDDSNNGEKSGEIILIDTQSVDKSKVGFLSKDIC